MSQRIAVPLLAFLCAAASGCGDRNEGWDTTPEINHIVSLSGSFAVIDESVNKVSFFGVQSGTSLTTHRADTGRSVAAAAPSPSGDKLYVLTQGVRPRLRPQDDAPAVRVYDGTGGGGLLETYLLDEPLNGMTVDPEGQFVVVHPSGDADSFLENPNELVIIDVTKKPGPDNPVMRTLRSFGGTPERLTFTKSMSLPGGQRRLLVVETEQEVSILDLNNLDRPEVTVLLNSADGKTHVSPSAVLVDDGETERTDDTRIAVRTNEPGIFLLTLAPLPESKVGTVPNDFDIVVNIIGLSTTPSDFAFVRTDSGRRLAVLEPSQNHASLIDPDTTVVTPVSLPVGYGSMAVVTDRTGTDSTGSDVALLWGGYSAATGVAFWSLGKSVDEPYRSIEVLPGVSSTVGEVVDVPAPADTSLPDLSMLKVLVPSYLSTGYGGGTGSFYVLDLAHRTATPLLTSANRLSMTLSRDGQRAWFYQEGSTKLAKVDLRTLHPVNLYLDQAAKNVFDIRSQKGGNAVVALHAVGNYAATIFDAASPDDANAARYVGLLQGGF